MKYIHTVLHEYGLIVRSVMLMATDQPSQNAIFNKYISRQARVPSIP
jgi:hypothetical protein